MSIKSKSSGKKSLVKGKGVVGDMGVLSWIVLQLLERGEDPKKIRIVDIRAPTRQDLTTGKAKEVRFVKADVSSPLEVIAAFLTPWEDGIEGYAPTTVFHSVANIRFWERCKFLLGRSEWINLRGTKNVVAAARAVGADVLVYTSTASVTTRANRFWVFPWERYPKHFVQVLNDESPLPQTHYEFFSNYAASKAKAEKLVRDAHKTKLPQGGILRTGCIRPGNGVYGPGGDTLVGAYLVLKTNMTFIKHIIQSFVYVENCALAHLLYEQRLLELASDSKNPDIGGQAFNICDPNPPIAYDDTYQVLSTLNPETKFIHLPPVLMLGLSHLIEAYYVTRLYVPGLQYILPETPSRMTLLQPSIFNLVQSHLVFDDSRAKKLAKDGGLDYQAPYTSLEALCNLVIEWTKEGKREEEIRVVGGRMSFAAGLEINFVERDA
ncbi:hypothetical protein M422DRAFT_74407 [Sphaerobolus stellatus SS14]|nr:hypothetical protein M422DRAFT_74407 [Sphaerobolus stellatus SS14]